MDDFYYISEDDSNPTVDEIGMIEDTYEARGMDDSLQPDLDE